MKIKKADNISYHLEWNDHAGFHMWAADMVRGMLERGFLVQKGVGLNMHFEPIHFSEYMKKATEVGDGTNIVQKHECVFH